MKFLCDQCKAKYQIADEKVQGKTLKMKCRKCGHIIEIRATGDALSIAPPGTANATMQLSALEDGDLHLPPNKVPTGLGPAKVSPPRAAAIPRATPTAAAGLKPTPRPAVVSEGRPSVRPPGGVAASKESAKSDSALASAFSKVASSGSSATAESSGSSRASTDLPAEEWYCAIDGVPVGPIRLTELRGKYAQGAVTGESLVWREGFEEWRPLLTLPDLHLVVREEVSVAGPPPRGPVNAGPPTRTRSTSGSGRPSNRPMAAAPTAASNPRGNGNVIPFVTRQGGAAARRFDDLPEHEDDEVTRIAEAPVVAFDPAASALAKAGFGPSPSDAKITEDPGGSRYAGALVAAGGAGSLTAEDLDGARPSMIDGIRAKAKAKGISLLTVAAMCAAFLLAGIAITVILVKPKAEIRIEREIQEKIIHEQGPTVYVTASAVASAAPTAATARAPSGPSGPVAAAAPTEAAPTRPAAVDHSPKPPGADEPPGPPDPGGGGGGEPLSTDAIQTVVNGKRLSVRKSCIDMGPGIGDGIALTLTLTIAPDGSVSGADVNQTKGDSGVGSCLSRHARQWRFPTSGSGRKVNVPFLFGAGG